MTRTPVLVAVAVVAVAAAIIVGIAALGSDDGDGGSSSGLPVAEGTAAPIDFRIVYRVTTPDSSSVEEHVVHRPFEAHIIQREVGGRVTAERWSTLGKLITRSQGAEAVSITTAIAPAASDLRPDRLSRALAEAEKATVHPEEIQVGGRTCRLVSEADEAATADPGPVDVGSVGSVPVVISRCVDDVGLVLEERWTTADGERVLTKRAQELELGDDVPEIELPDAEPLSDDQGNGAVQKVADDAVPPFAEVFTLAAPEGYTFVGRYAVAPARIATGVSSPTTDPDVRIALYTDVWRKGADLLQLDQGAAVGTAAPFDPETRIGQTDLGALGTAEVAADLRSAEVRLTRADGGFVRLAGTIPPTELVELARTLQLEETP